MSIITTTDSYLTPFADDHSKTEPPDPLPNSEVKRLSADGSVVRPCESRSSSALYSKKTPLRESEGGFSLFGIYMLNINNHKYQSPVACPTTGLCV